MKDTETKKLPECLEIILMKSCKTIPIIFHSVRNKFLRVNKKKEEVSIIEKTGKRSK